MGVAVTAGDRLSRYVFEHSAEMFQHQLDLRTARRVVPKPLEHAAQTGGGFLEVRVLVENHGEWVGAAFGEAAH